MLKHIVIAYKNRFPGARIDADQAGTYVRAYYGDECQMACRREGDGVVSSDPWAFPKHKHSTDPIARNSRVWKEGKDGNPARDEKADEREKVAKALAEKFEGKVPSIVELEKAGYKLKYSSRDEYHRAEVEMPEAPKSK